MGADQEISDLGLANSRFRFRVIASLDRKRLGADSGVERGYRFEAISIKETGTKPLVFVVDVVSYGI